MDKKEWYKLHKEVMRAYYEDDAEIECYEMNKWCGTLPTWNTDKLYRIKPTTRIINGFEVPKPIKEPLEDGQKYYISAISIDDFCSLTIWYNDEADNMWLERGLVHLTKENAIANAKAMLGINPYEE